MSWSAILHEHCAAVEVQPWMCRCSFSFSLSNSTYFGPFIAVLGGMNYRPAVPWHNMTLQLIWLSRCSIVAATYFLSKHLPNSCLSGDVQSAAWCISQKTTLSSTQGETSLFFFITGVWCGFCAGLWDSSPNSLLRHLKKFWSLLLYLLSVKQHRFSCKSSTVSTLLSVSLAGLPWVP